jgi:arylsulfatase A-like enzyme
VSWFVRMLLGAAVGCCLGAVQTVLETLGIAVLYDRFLLHPATFFNARMYDAFTKILLSLDLPGPRLGALDVFVGQGFAAKLAIGTDLLLANFLVGAALGAALALLLSAVIPSVRRDGRRLAVAVLIGLVSIGLAVHLSLWALNVQLPVEVTLKTGLRNAARNFVHDGTLFAVSILLVAAPSTALLVGAARRRPGTAAVAAAALICAACATQGAIAATASPALVRSEAAAPDYNVILISIDSLRADHLSAYGYARDTSPTIAALARDGVLFRHTSSTTSWTLPGHVSMLTGRSLLGHGVVTDAQSIAPDIPLISESFQAAGYATHAIVSAPYVESRYGFARGFDSYDDKTIQFATHGASYKEVTAPLLQRTAAEWLGKNAGKKFFLFLHYWDVHYDYAPGPPYDTMFDPHYEGGIDGVNFYFNPAVHAGMAPRDLEHVVALYDGEIRLVDDHLAMLRATLAELGVDRKTIIVVTSDHGDEFFEHDRKGHHRTLYDEVLRVPLVLHVPDVKPSRSEVLMETSIIDIMPTLLGLTGLPIPPGVEGVDLTGIAFHGDEEWDRTTVAELYRVETLNVQVSLRKTGQKLIHHFNDRLAEVYDIAADPGEKKKLRLTHKPATDLMNDLLFWLNDRWAAYRARIDAGLDRAVTMDADTHERLRALGYVE